MSDEGLRALERRWKASGSPRDEAVYLVARIRRGELTESRVALAAALRHPGALEAIATLRRPEGLPQDPPEGLSEAGREAWLRLSAAPPNVELDFDSLDHEAAARMAIPALEVALENWKEKCSSWQGGENPEGVALARELGAEEAVLETLAECRAWCQQPDTVIRFTDIYALLKSDHPDSGIALEVRFAGLYELIERLRQEPPGVDWQDWPDTIADDLMDVLGLARMVCSTTLIDSPGNSLQEIGRNTAAMTTFRADPIDPAIDDAQREQVVPWALGYSADESVGLN
jgi:hypothetical protein